MISNIEEAKELCKKFGINLKDHKTVIVTENNNIYLSDNIDPKDIGKVFRLKGETITVEEVVKPSKKDKKEEPSKDISNGESDNNI